MLKTIPFIGLAVAMLTSCQVCAAADLSKVDRSITKEPQYQSQPRYCLLVFGEEAETRVWLIEDGETIYVDRNANGDLTDNDEVVTPTRKRDLQTYRDAHYEVGEIVPSDGSPRHTNFELTRYQRGDDPTQYVVKMRVNGQLQQFAGWRPLFAESRDEAKVIHFSGKFIPRPLRDKQLSLTKKSQEVHLCLITPGQGEGSNAMLGYEAIPRDIVPIAGIEWPTAESGKTIRTEVTLVDRC